MLRNQCMLHSIREDELQKSRARILQQNAEKEERVKELAQEVETIRNSVGSLEERREGVVDFDEGEDCAKFERLETIREVSEHDLPVTMSTQSLRSGLIEEGQLGEASASGANAGGQESLIAESCQIDNYQDALKFLKNYNNQGMKTTQKPVQQKRGNDTINRIKRMRRIDDQNNQENICQGNEVPIVQSKLEYVEEEGRSCASIASSKFRSRVKEAAVSLEEPVRAVT